MGPWVSTREFVLCWGRNIEVGGWKNLVGYPYSCISPDPGSRSLPIASDVLVARAFAYACKRLRMQALTHACLMHAFKRKRMRECANARMHAYAIRMRIRMRMRSQAYAFASACVCVHIRMRMRMRACVRMRMRSHSLSLLLALVRARKLALERFCTGSNHV